MAEEKKGRVVDMGRVGVSGQGQVKRIAAPQVGPNGRDVPMAEGDYRARRWLNEGQAWDAIRSDPNLLRAQQAAVFEAWHRINARDWAPFFGKVTKIQTGLMCDFPAMVFELSPLQKRDAATGQGVCDGKSSVRFGTAISEIPEIIGHMYELYRKAAIKYGEKVRTLEECYRNVSGHEDGNPTIKKD